jgi:hypothetical protein
MSVRTALYKKLNEDEPLKKICNGIFHRELDKESQEAGVDPPIVIFHKAAGRPLWAMSGPSLDKEFWVVKGVGTAAEAEAIDKRCREILDGGELAISGKVNQDLRHVSDVNYGEVVNGERVDHIGAEYKIDSEST